jgi:hypothetical protein
MSISLSDILGPNRNEKRDDEPRRPSPVLKSKNSSRSQAQPTSILRRRLSKIGASLRDQMTPDSPTYLRSELCRMNSNSNMSKQIENISYVQESPRMSVTEVESKLGQECENLSSNFQSEECPDDSTIVADTKRKTPDTPTTTRAMMSAMNTTMGTTMNTTQITKSTEIKTNITTSPTSTTNENFADISSEEDFQKNLLNISKPSIFRRARSPNPPPQISETSDFNVVPTPLISRLQAVESYAPERGIESPDIDKLFTSIHISSDSSLTESGLVADENINRITQAMSEALRVPQFVQSKRLDTLIKGATFIFLTSAGSKYTTREWIRGAAHVISKVFFMRYSLPLPPLPPPPLFFFPISCYLFLLFIYFVYYI